MKRLFILIAVCMIGMVLPQRMLAAEYTFNNLKITISDDGQNVIIESDEVGALKNANFNPKPEAIQAIAEATGEIKFKGQFNQEDLDRLKSIKIRGTDYVCCVQKKVDMSQAEFPQSYQQMTFKNWASTLEEAITSQYADNNISNDIFQDCKSLTKVNFLAGTVKGFTDHKEETGYATGLNVTIGKGVTSIDGNAFMRCDVLTTVTFDKDYSGGETPKDLTIGQSAFQDCTNLTGIEFPNRVTNIGPSAFKEAGTSVDEFSVSFERREVSQGASVDYDVDLTIGASAFQNCTTLKTLSLPIRLTTLGDNVFAGTTNLTTVEIREDLEDARLTVIPPGAFLDSGISTITIPRSVTLIRTGAFQECFDLESIYFQESHQNPQPDLVIETRAFAGGDEHKYKLKDVFVNIDPKKRKLICEYDAFNFTSLVGQTDITSGQMATLHFSEDYWDYYAGDWKKGVSFTQTALNSFKDGCDPTKNALEGESMNDQSKKGTNDQIHASNGRIPNMSPGNGWHQFARTDTGIDIIIEKGTDFRTYSTEVALVKPSWMHIYRVTNFDDGFKENSNASSREEADAATKVATTEEIVVGVDVANCIPLNTGVIRVDFIKNDAIYYIMEWEDLKSAGITYNDAWEYPYQDDLDKDKVNFMKPTTTPENNPEVTYIYPVERNENGDITHRVFGLKKVQKEDGSITGEFLRAKRNTKMARNRAYLSLPAGLFHWEDESTSSGQGATGTIPNNSTNNSKISLIIDTDFDLGIDGGITTEIKEAIEAEMYKNDSFYTIQGIKVAKPTTKGVYIRNGKKIYIK